MDSEKKDSPVFVEPSLEDSRRLKDEYYREGSSNIYSEQDYKNLTLGSPSLTNLEESTALASMKPIYNLGSVIGLIDENSSDPSSFSNILKKTIEKSEERRDQAILSGGDTYGLSNVEYLPETYLALRTPASLYSGAFVAGKGMLSSAIPLGLLEGEFYNTARNNESVIKTLSNKPNRKDFNDEDNYNDAYSQWKDKLVGNALYDASSASIAKGMQLYDRSRMDLAYAMNMKKSIKENTPVDFYSGKVKYSVKIKDDGTIDKVAINGVERDNHRFIGEHYSDIVPKYRTITTEDVLRTGYSTANRMYQLGSSISNKAADYVGGKAARAIVPSVVAYGLINPDDAEGGMLNFASKVLKRDINVGIKPKSSDEIELVTAKNYASIPDDDVALALANEKQLITDYSEIENISLKELDSDFIEAIDKEFERGFNIDEPSDISVGVDDIENASHRYTKQEPTETQSFYAKTIDEAMPIHESSGVNKGRMEHNKAAREALGNVYKTGVNFDELRTFINETTEGAKNYSKHIISKLSKTERETVEEYIDNIAAHIKDNSVPVKYAKNARTLVEKFGIKSDDELIDAIDTLTSAKLFDSLDKETIELTRQAMREHPQTIRQAFGSRDAVRSKTKSLIEKGSLKQEDEIFAYTKPTYEENLKHEIMTKEELDSLMSYSKVKDTVSKLFGKKPTIIKVNKLDNDMYEVLLRDSRRDFAQGALPHNPHETRGTRIRLGRPVGVQYAEALAASGRVPTKVKMNIVNKDGNIIAYDKVVSYKQYKDQIEKLGNKEYKNKSIVVEVSRPLTNEEKSLLGENNDISSVVGNTVASVQKDLSLSNMYKDIRRSYATKINNDNLSHFLENASESSEYIFISPSDVKMLHNKEFLQYVANNYVKINDAEMVKNTGARYVQRRFAHELLGYNKTFISKQKYSIGRYIEDVHHYMVKVFRDSVITKNPVAFVNNIVGGAFTNSSFMYITYGEMSAKGFTGLPKAFNSYKEFKELRHKLISAKSINDNEAVAEIRSLLENNMAYQLYKRGGIQSLLDDGLLDSRMLDASNDKSWLRESIDNVFLTEDSYAGSKARTAFDISDISNRVNLYTMLIEKGMDADKAASITNKVSVSYTRLLSPSMMFARDNGIVPFITWYSRVAPVMAGLAFSNPTRVLTMQMLYWATVNQIGSQDSYGNDYIAGVRVESYNWYNSLSASSAIDMVGEPVHRPSSYLPKYMTNDVGQNMLGVTTQ